MNQNYEPEFKKKIVRLYLEEGRTLRGLAEEYGIFQNTICEIYHSHSGIDGYRTIHVALAGEAIQSAG